MAAAAIGFRGIEGFDWDEHNFRKIREKHNVHPRECEEVLLGAPRIVEDLGHSGREERFVAFGSTTTGRRLAVVFTLRGSLARVVTARAQSRKERRELGDG